MNYYVAVMLIIGFKTGLLLKMDMYVRMYSIHGFGKPLHSWFYPIHCMKAGWQNDLFNWLSFSKTRTLVIVPGV